MGARFVIRKRSRGRFQLLLEVGGELRVWTLRASPSKSPADKPLADEDGSQPLEGALAEQASEDDPAVVWDAGTWVCEGDPLDGMKRGKLRFELHGYKLRGGFSLGRNKGKWLRRERRWEPSVTWTLIKAPDEHADMRALAGVSHVSVLTGLEVEDGPAELRDEVRRLAAELGATRGRVDPGDDELAAPTGPVPPFSDDEWLFELRRRGVRVRAVRPRTRARLSGEGGESLAGRFPEVVAALEALPLSGLVVEAELGIEDLAGRPNASALEERMDDRGVEPATLRMHDLLAVEGFDLRALSLADRKRILAAWAPTLGPLRYADHVVGRGEELCALVRDGEAIGCEVHARTDDDWLLLDAEARPSRVPVTSSANRPRELAAIRLTNPQKVYWPDDGITKGQLLEYYRAIGPVLLPYLDDRPLVLERFPDGIHGRAFFQHHAPGAKSEWMRTVRIRMSRRVRDYFLCATVESVLFLANQGSIPLHVWPSRASSLERPDWCCIDVDRSEATTEDVMRAALAVGELCDTVELPSFVKTSGSTGMHVLIPLGGQLAWEQTRMLGELLARTVAREQSALCTTELEVARRGTRVYLDFMVNHRGRMLVAPYSARPVSGARVSTPLRWEEVDLDLDPGAHTILTVPDRVASAGDPWADMLGREADVARGLALLSERVRD